ncbi:Putative membrane protein [Corynebacterium camporealensis]|uniref:Putative membrane protein n=1 Tax=Corynebacterium camporealensis TaxID=161896 RepID=A0A0F6QVW3_9CORY|nr:DUF368 domain-containing protein [Corynebacterium camporealensis]AKE39062.1 putative membrane protein [Corynebacterium camporealensis]AVH88289.1 Putative membrane protein [Corynebacterium camporealensis]
MQYLLNVLRGALIGSAELVPGISGGTIALIVGIYERALENGNDLISGRFKKVDWAFLATVAIGMFVAIFGLSTILSNFVENQVSISSALFMGMVAISIFVPIAMMDKSARLTGKSIITFLIAAAVIFIVTGFTSEPVDDPSLIVVFFAAAIAVCALILPGVSGSLILLTMGLYQPIIGAVSDREMGTVAVFALGALCGLAAFVKLLNWLLHHHRNVTLAAMAGFMLGSLRALWPFGEGQDAGTLPIIGVFFLGVIIVGFFIWIDAQQAKKYKAKADS